MLENDRNGGHTIFERIHGMHSGDGNLRSVEHLRGPELIIFAERNILRDTIYDASHEALEWLSDNQLVVHGHVHDCSRLENTRGLLRVILQQEHFLL